MKNETKTKTERSKQNRVKIIAFRKSCKADGTGLSHYVLMDRGAQR